MPAFVNFKICDNSKECSGIEVCPFGAITYNEELKTIEIDNSKCISCGSCEKACPIGAFKVAKNSIEAKVIQQEIEKDERTIKDLFVDRYGATPLSEFFMLDANALEEKIKDKNLVFIEIFKEDTIECLLKSIPIKEITKDLDKDILFYKVECNERLEKKFSINIFPSILIFRNGKFIDKVEGYYSEDQKSILISKINEILQKNFI